MDKGADSGDSLARKTPKLTLIHPQPCYPASILTPV